MLENQLEELRRSTLAAFASAGSLETLEEVRIEVLGRKGTLAQIRQDFGKLPADEKKKLGKVLNAVTQDLEAEYAAKKERFEKAALAEQLAGEWIDVTLPRPACVPVPFTPSPRSKRKSKIFSLPWASLFCMALKWNWKNTILTR